MGLRMRILLVQPRGFVHTHFTNSLVEYQEYTLENTRKLSMMLQLKQKCSPIWEYFELVDAIQDGKKIKKARCKLCKNTQLAYKGSTTNMINHIQAKHHSAYQESFPSSQSSSSSSTKRQATLSLVTNKCSPAHSKEIDELVSDFVTRYLRPIAIFEQKHVNYSDCQLLINFNNY